MFVVEDGQGDCASDSVQKKNFPRLLLLRWRSNEIRSGRKVWHGRRRGLVAPPIYFSSYTPFPPHPKKNRNPTRSQTVLLPVAIVKPLGRFQAVDLVVLNRMVVDQCCWGTFLDFVGSQEGRRAELTQAAEVKSSSSGAGGGFVSVHMMSGSSCGVRRNPMKNLTRSNFGRSNIQRNPVDSKEIQRNPGIDVWLSAAFFWLSLDLLHKRRSLGNLRGWSVRRCRPPSG